MHTNRLNWRLHSPAPCWQSGSAARRSTPPACHLSGTSPTGTDRSAWLWDGTATVHLRGRCPQVVGDSRRRKTSDIKKKKKGNEGGSSGEEGHEVVRCVPVSELCCFWGWSSQSVSPSYFVAGPPSGDSTCWRTEGIQTPAERSDCGGCRHSSPQTGEEKVKSFFLNSKTLWSTFLKLIKNSRDTWQITCEVHFGKWDFFFFHRFALISKTTPLHVALFHNDGICLLNISSFEQTANTRHALHLHKWAGVHENNTRRQWTDTVIVVRRVRTCARHHKLISHVLQYKMIS